MQKYIGFILIVLSGVGIGFTSGQELKLRTSDMREIKRIFLFLKSEIQYTRTTFPIAFDRIARRCHGVYREWLVCVSQKLEQEQGKCIQEIWGDTAKEYLQKTRLKKSDIELIQMWGSNMGHLDVEAQMNALFLFLEQWEELIQRTSIEVHTKQRLYRCLGVMGGIFLVILLV